MAAKPLHPRPSSVAEAIAIQKDLAARVDTSKSVDDYRTVAAADVSFDKFDPWLYASVVVARRESHAVVEVATAAEEAEFPYVPGLLSFREAPPILVAFQALKARPDVLICDGQGVAHPRRMGLACHLGLWLGLPTIGCAKSKLCGTYDEPGTERGDRSPLMDKGEVIGAVLRTRSRVSPLFVSAGHLCDLESAVRIVLESTTRYRLPDVSRLAHEQVNALRKASKEPPR